MQAEQGPEPFCKGSSVSWRSKTLKMKVYSQQRAQCTQLCQRNQVKRATSNKLVKPLSGRPARKESRDRSQPLHPPAPGLPRHVPSGSEAALGLVSDPKGRPRPPHRGGPAPAGSLLVLAPGLAGCSAPGSAAASPSGGTGLAVLSSI